MSTVADPNLIPWRPEPAKGQPAWDVALLFPTQGHWTEAAYLALDTNRLVELVDHSLEVLPVPSVVHQWIAQYLFKLLDAFITARQAGFVFIAPLPVHLWVGQFREPDVLFVTPGRIRHRKPPEGADLVMEVVSEGAKNRERDVETKRHEYAKAGIQEYWIVDPQERKITVLSLAGNAYRVHGEFTSAGTAASALWPEFTVDVAAVFAAGEQVPE